MAEGNFLRHHMRGRHRAAAARAMTDVADNIGLGDDAGHPAAVVTDDDQIVARIVQQSCGVDQQGVGCNRNEAIPNCW
jgi:hypothetical protein